MSPTALIFDDELIAYAEDDRFAIPLAQFEWYVNQILFGCNSIQYSKRYHNILVIVSYHKVISSLTVDGIRIPIIF